MSVDQKPTVAINVVRRVLDQDRPPDLAHHFVLTRVGGDILLEGGYFDLVELKEAIDSSASPGEVGTATLTIHHRLLLTKDVLEQLSHAVGQILTGLEKPINEE